MRAASLLVVASLLVLACASSLHSQHALKKATHQAALRAETPKCCCCDPKTGVPHNRAYACSEVTEKGKCKKSKNIWLEIKPDQSCRAECPSVKSSTSPSQSPKSSTSISQSSESSTSTSPSSESSPSTSESSKSSGSGTKKTKCCCCNPKTGRAEQRSYTCDEVVQKGHCEAGKNLWLEIKPDQSCRAECPSTKGSSSTSTTESSKTAKSTESTSSSEGSTEKSTDTSTSNEGLPSSPPCVYVPGATRPPHKGHYSMVTEAARMFPSAKVVVVMSEDRRNDRHGITAATSKHIWKDYYFPVLKEQNVNVEFLGTPRGDPHIAAWGHGVSKCGCTQSSPCVVMAGDDRATYKERVQQSEQYKNKFKYHVFEERIGGGEISATKLCKTLAENKDNLSTSFKESFANQYLPALPQEQLDELITELASKCT